MKVAFIAAGAANMYCGSCLRDNAVASAMLRQGEDVLLIPLYTPMRLDRDDVTIDRVFFGGINIFLQQKSKFFRRWGFLHSFFDSKPMLKLASRFAEMTEAADLGELTVSTLKGDEGNQAAEVTRLANWLADDIKPDVVNLPNAMFVGAAREIKQRTGVPVVCTLTGEDVFIDAMVEPYKSETISLMQAAARHVDVFISVSEYYAGLMAGMMQVPREKIRVVPLGVKPEGFGLKGERKTDPFTVGYLGRVSPEKGLHILCEAFHELTRMPGGENARLRVAGWMGAQHRSYLEENKAKMREWGLGDRFEYVGEVSFDEKVRFLDSVSVVSMPAVYRDPKGLSILEAMAHGLPVVQPDHGAFPEVLEATGGGLLFKADDPKDLARQLHKLVTDPELADRLGRQGQTAVREKFTDEHMARSTIDVYKELL